jgi:mercuric ion binding protein
LAWIGNFTRLAPYQRYFIAATISFLGYGYSLVYRPSTRAYPMLILAHARCPTGWSRLGRLPRRSWSLPRWTSISSPRCSSPHERSIPMSKLFACATLALCVVASPAAFAAEKAIILAVSNMHCADCPFIVKKDLERVQGVAKVAVSYKDKTAVVTYEDCLTDVKGLTAATTGAGYPSAPKC